MGRTKKFDYQEVIESSLNAQPEGLTLDEILERSGLKVDRSTLFRHLTRVIEMGRAERIGDARASRYRPLGAAATSASPAPAHAPPAAVKPAGVHRPVRAEPASVPVQTPEHGAAVEQAVRAIVREWKRYNQVNLQIYLSLFVKPEHLNEVTAAVEQELAGLNAGNLAKFRLTQAEFAAFVPPAKSEAAGG